MSKNNNVYPVNDYSRSYWMNSNPGKLANYRSTNDLPDYSDIVIIGSGYAGATCAYYLYKNETSQKITMLEAREACSGATGRNGGHLNADMYVSYTDYSKKYGSQTTEEMIEFEVKHLEEIDKLVREENIDCDLEFTRTCHAYYDQEIANQAKTSYEKRRDDGGNVSDIYEIPSDVLRSETRLKDVIYGVTFTGASIHPYKFIHHLLNKCVEQGLNLQTNTCVVSATCLPSGSKWSIVTSRGTIEASKVIFATNAYTGGIIPVLNEKIIPIRATVCRIIPTENFTQKPLKMTYGIRSKGSQFDYMLPRQVGDRSIILGGSKPTYFTDKNSWYNNWDDSPTIINEQSAKYFEEFMSKYFDDWGADKSEYEEVWTAVFGGTSDAMPFVGELPDEKNGFVIAGFNGHGMSRILLCARALIDLVLEKVNTIEGLIPQPLIITKDRLDNNEN